MEDNPTLRGDKMGFMGEYQHSIDGKGRLIVPAKFREGLGENFIVTKGLDKCLFVYHMSQWTELEEKLRKLPLTDSNARGFVRFFFSGATECEVDKQGRILLPANLREHAGLDKDVILAGVANRVEIWSKDIWSEYSAEMAEGSYEAMAETLAAFNSGI